MTKSSPRKSISKQIKQAMYDALLRGAVGLNGPFANEFRS